MALSSATFIVEVLPSEAHAPGALTSRPIGAPAPDTPTTKLIPVIVILALEVAVSTVMPTSTFTKDAEVAVNGCR